MVCDRSHISSPSFNIDGTTDPMLKPAIDCTSLLLSSFDTNGATDPALKLAIDHISLLLSSFDIDGSFLHSILM
jgi:hypothetical protein